MSLTLLEKPEKSESRATSKHGLSLDRILRDTTKSQSASGHPLGHQKTVDQSPVLQEEGTWLGAAPSIAGVAPQLPWQLGAASRRSDLSKRGERGRPAGRSGLISAQRIPIQRSDLESLNGRYATVIC